MVDSIGDDGDAAPGDGVCADGAGDCTFRAAVDEAEARGGHDVVTFGFAERTQPYVIRIGSPRIQLIDDPAGMTIDGYSQPGSAENTLDHGSNAAIKIEFEGEGPGGIDFLDFRSGGNVVRGIAIRDFQRHLRFWGSSASGNEVTGNFIGTDAGGTVAATSRVSGSNGVHIERGASGNRIGMPGNQHRNVISGNADKGISLFDGGTTGTLIRNNLIGLAPDGVSELANQGHGVDIGLGASDTQVGGFSAADRNVISGNDLSGVEISHNSSGGSVTQRNVIAGNWIGTSADGTVGTAATANHEHGVNLEGNERCVTTCPPDITDNTVTGNVIVGSGQANVIIWKAAFGNVVSNNHIGVLPDGGRPASWHETIWGVMIQAGAFDNVVRDNTIRWLDRGVHLKPDNNYENGEDPFPTSGNVISRNAISDIEQGLGIDHYRERVAGSGVYWPDEVDPPSPFVNGGITKPTVVSASTDAVVVDGCPGCTIEVFEATTPTCTNCYASYGRGDRFVVDDVATAARHTITLRTSQADPYVLLPGVQIALTVTDAAGNTSEFSRRVLVGAGSIPPPDSTTTTTTTTSTTVPVTTTTVPVQQVDRVDGPGTVSQTAVRCRFSSQC